MVRYGNEGNIEEDKNRLCRLEISSDQLGKKVGVRGDALLIPFPPLSTAGFRTGGWGITDKKLILRKRGIDGTNGYFRQNSEPFFFCGRENNSELRSVEQK
jgi:hypothetical protein